MSQIEPAPRTPATTEQRLDRYGRWLALIANIGVVLGLFALIIEIRQNAELTRVATENQLNEFMLDTEMHLASPEQAAAWVKSYNAPETMTKGVHMYDVAAPIVANLDDNYMRDLYAGLRPSASPPSP